MRSLCGVYQVESGRLDFFRAHIKVAKGNEAIVVARQCVQRLAFIVHKEVGESNARSYLYVHSTASLRRQKNARGQNGGPIARVARSSNVLPSRERLISGQDQGE